MIWTSWSRSRRVSRPCAELASHILLHAWVTGSYLMLPTEIYRTGARQPMVISSLFYSIGFLPGRRGMGKKTEGSTTRICARTQESKFPPLSLNRDEPTHMTWSSTLTTSNPTSDLTSPGT
jgi:hypothetical protein